MPADDTKQGFEVHAELSLSLEVSELRRANARLSALLNSTKLDVIVATDPHGVITVFNSGAERILGYSAGEMIGKQTPAVFHLASEIEARGRS